MYFLSRVKLCGRSCWNHLFACKQPKQRPYTMEFELVCLNINDNIDRNIHTSTACQKFFPFPDHIEAEKLLNYFPEPIKLVEELLQPFTSVSSSCQPNLTFKPFLKATKWRANLSFSEPVPFTVIGCADSYVKAKTNVYLQACKMFWDLGLIYRYNNKIVPAKETVQSSITELSKDNIKIFKNFHLTFDQLKIKNQIKWRSSLMILWPNITVTAICETPSTAEYKCYLQALIKLKRLKYLNTENANVNPQSWIRIPSALNLTNFDFHIYFDASEVGFGAYYFSPEGSDVKWFHDRWPDFLVREINSKRTDTAFIEFYAMVVALYTWKHKFSKKSVLCFTDNLSVVSLVNKGIHLPKKAERYHKLFSLLKGLTQTYHISLTVKHIYRENNTAADFLAKHNIKEFRRMVPNAKVKSKKSKKLLFCLPNK